MTDPWWGVRDGKYQPSELDDEVTVYLAIDVEPLIDDADALLAVVRVAKTYRDSHTMEGANKGELLMDFTDRIVAERAAIDKALAALPEHLRGGAC